MFSGFGNAFTRRNPHRSGLPKEIVESAKSKEDKEKEEREEWNRKRKEFIDREIQKLENYLIASADATLEQFEKMHEKDKMSYSFSCTRVGDFLVVNATRNGRSEQSALNLARTRRITLVEGHGPDRNRRVSYVFHGNNVSENRTFNDVRPYSIFSEPKQHERRGFSDSLSIYPQPTRTTPNLPRGAEDDLIHFDGLDLILHAPASFGKKVRDDIMAELAKGSLPNVKVYEPVASTPQE